MPKKMMFDFKKSASFTKVPNFIVNISYDRKCILWFKDYKVLEV